MRQARRCAGCLEIDVKTAGANGTGLHPDLHLLMEEI